MESQAWPPGGLRGWVWGLRFGVYGFGLGIPAQRSAGKSTRSPKLEQEAAGAFRGGVGFRVCGLGFGGPSEFALFRLRREDCKNTKNAQQSFSKIDSAYPQPIAPEPKRVQIPRIQWQIFPCPLTSCRGVPLIKAEWFLDMCKKVA